MFSSHLYEVGVLFGSCRGGGCVEGDPLCTLTILDSVHTVLVTLPNFRGRQEGSVLCLHLTELLATVAYVVTCE